MCVMKVFNFIIILFRFKKKVHKSEVNRILLDSRDQWREKCISQSRNYLRIIDKLKQEQIDLS